MEITKTFNIKIHGIELVEKHQNRLIPGVNTKEQLFDLTLNGSVDKGNKLIIYFATGVVRPNDQAVELAKITIACGYYIDNIDDALQSKDDGTFIIDVSLDLMLRSITISTLRGVFFSELRGTPLHKVFLPIIDPKSLQPSTEKIT